MSGERYTYATVGISEDREEPVVATGKRNATFEIGGEEFDRTAILKLPERMTESEFNQWKSEAGIDLLDIYFHCVKQTPRHPKPEPDDPGKLIPDGGSETDPSEEEIEHRCSEAYDQLARLQDTAEEELPIGAEYLGAVLQDIERAEELLKNESPASGVPDRWEPDPAAEVTVPVSGVRDE